MRILYYFFELDTPMYQWQRQHIFDELERKGHSFVTFNPALYDSFDEANQQLIRFIRASEPFDLFLTGVDSSEIYRETLAEIRKLGLPSALICWDNLELPCKHKKVADMFDVVWLTSIETKYLFERWGCGNILFQPYAANPYVFRPCWKETLPCVGFVGSPYGSRINKLNELTRHRIPCAAYSDSFHKKGYNTSVGGVLKRDLKTVLIKASRYMSFPIGRKVLYAKIKNMAMITESRLRDDPAFLQQHPAVSVDEMCALYANFALSLNISELRDTYVLSKPIHKIHLRAFEIPMCGGLQLASYTHELALYFEEDKEIIFYRSAEEMVDKCRFYLDEKNETTVRRIKQAARVRAERKHTWSNRFRRLFDALR